MAKRKRIPVDVSAEKHAQFKRATRQFGGMVVVLRAFIDQFLSGEFTYTEDTGRIERA